MPEVIVSNRMKEIGRYTLDTGSINIGKAPGNDIVLDSPAIEAHHARIVNVENSYHIHDLATTNGTFVNDSLVSRIVLSHDDQIRIGHYSMRFLNRIESAQSTGHGIEILSGPNKSKWVNFGDGRTVLGVGTLRVVAVERRESSVLPVYRLTPINSKVGVRINDSYIDHDRSVDLSNNDRIEFLNLMVRFFDLK